MSDKRSGKETQKEEFIDIILDSIADGVFTIDDDNIITSFNSAAERITGVSRRDAVGRKCHDIFHASICSHDCALKKTIDTGQEVIDQKIDIISADGEKIPVTISTAVLRDKEGAVLGGVETFRDLSVIEALKKEIAAKYTFEDIISKNRKILDIFDILPDIAESESTVLIEGKSGTGKELFARAIHNLSPRKDGPFVAVNCGALPDTLLESELFGYVKGAFTNAVKDKPGRFELARGGTILLDEIAEMPQALQVKLLRVIQEKEYEPLGSVKKVKADVRIVASTNREIKQEVERGNFRTDLYFRLNVMRLRIPDLSERREDIPILIDHFVEKMSRKLGKEIAGVSDEVLDHLMRYDYSGNVRELENIIEHGAVLCRSEWITARDLPQEIFGGATLGDVSASGVQISADPRDCRDVTAEAERQVIAETLARFKGSRVKTAQALNLNKSTLWRKMKKHQLL